MLRRIFTFAMIFILGVSAMSAENKMQTKQGTILHCWCWSFKTIEDNIEKSQKRDSLQSRLPQQMNAL